MYYLEGGDFPDVMNDAVGWFGRCDRSRGGC